MSICIKDQIQNMNLVIGCTVGCAYCYARNNVKRWHIISIMRKSEGQRIPEKEIANFLFVKLNTKIEHRKTDR